MSNLCCYHPTPIILCGEILWRLTTAGNNCKNEWGSTQSGVIPADCQDVSTRQIRSTHYASLGSSVLPDSSFLTLRPPYETPMAYRAYYYTIVALTRELHILKMFIYITDFLTFLFVLNALVINSHKLNIFFSNNVFLVLWVCSLKN